MIPTAGDASVELSKLKLALPRLATVLSPWLARLRSVPWVLISLVAIGAGVRSNLPSSPLVVC